MVIENWGNALEIKSDITNTNDIESAINQSLAKFGSLDILVNNAQLEFGKSFSEVSDNQCWLSFEINFPSKINWWMSKMSPAINPTYNQKQTFLKIKLIIIRVVQFKPKR